MAIRIENLSKSFGRKIVLKGISFVLGDNEILGVVGPSGGGKTTLLRCLDLLEDLDSGSIVYESEKRIEIRSNHWYSEETICKIRSKIGYVFQSFNLWEEKTVIQNLALAPRVVLGHSRSYAEEQAELLCRHFGLHDKLHARVWELSGGQRQRVALIRSLLMQPKTLLLDEITSALDPVLTVDVMDFIRELKQHGLAMIVVTHHIEFASSLCDRIMFLSDGQIIQVDKPEELIYNPANDEISQFLSILRRAR